MTGSLRSSARTPFGVGLMAVLAIVFLLLGVGGGGNLPAALAAAGGQWVVIAGSHQLEATDFKLAWDNQKKKYEEQFHRPVTDEEMAAAGVDKAMLNEMELKQAQSELLTRAGIRPSNKLVDDTIRGMPFAFDRVSGKFDEKQYTQFLKQQGFTPARFEGITRDEIASEHFGQALSGLVTLPRAYGALRAVLALEQRDVSYFLFDPRTLPPPADPTDAQLNGFIKDHAAALKLPEMRILTVVRISAKDYMGRGKIEEADIAKALPDQLAKAAAPEKRTLVQVPARSAADAQAAAQALAGGADASAVAKRLGVEAISYVEKAQHEIPDHKLAAAAFGLKAGETRVVSGDFGSAAVRLISIRPAVKADAKSAREAVIDMLRKKAARDQAYKLSEAFDDARQSGASVADAARKAGLTPVTVGPVTADGRMYNSPPSPLLDDKVLKVAFAAAAGEETNIQDAGEGDYFAMKVEKVIPSALPSLADKRAELTAAYKQDALRKAVKEKVDALVATANKEGLAKASGGATIQHVNGMMRIKARSYASLGNEFVGGAFGVKPGDAFAAGGSTGVYIARVDSARPGDPRLAAAATLAAGGQTTQGWPQDMSISVRWASKSQIKTQVDLDRARRAVNIDPAKLASSGKAAK